MRLSTPVVIDVDGGGEGLRGGWGDTCEEVACEPSHLVLYHGDVELTLMQHVVGSIVGSHLQVDGALRFVQEGIEVVLCLFLTGLHIVLHDLCRVGDSQPCGGIEVAATAFVLELQSRYTFGDGIADDETAERYDASLSPTFWLVCFKRVPSKS